MFLLYIEESNYNNKQLYYTYERVTAMVEFRQNYHTSILERIFVERINIVSFTLKAKLMIRIFCEKDHRSLALILIISPSSFMDFFFRLLDIIDAYEKQVLGLQKQIEFYK